MQNNWSESGVMMSRVRVFIILWLVGVATAWAQTPEASSAVDGAAAEASNDSGEAEVETTAPTATPEQPIYASSDLRDMSLLADALPSDQVLWWTEPQGQVLALYNTAITAEPVGAVLIIQDQDLHANRPQRLAQLRLALPEHGWSALMVTLPLPTRLPVPAREPVAVVSEVAADSAKKDDAQERPETEEVFDDATGQVASVDELNQAPAVDPEAVKENTLPASQVADSRLAMAVQFLHDQGQFNLVLLAEGAGAVRATRLLAQMNHDGFRAVTLLDARNRLLGEQGDLAQTISMLSVPVLDLYEGQHLADVVEVEARRNAAKRAGLATFQQLKLPDYGPNQQVLIKRVRGFLDKHAKGVKVDNAQVITTE